MPDPYPVTDLAAWLAGRWQLERTITDAGGRPTAHFTGTLTVTRDGPATLRSQERGHLTHDGRTFPAHRRLRYDLHGATATVRFEHGGHFHELDLRTGRDDAVHPCGDDTYRGHTEVVDADRFVQVWRVTGPTEDYTSTTHATRTSPPT